MRGLERQARYAPVVLLTMDLHLPSFGFVPLGLITGLPFLWSAWRFYRPKVPGLRYLPALTALCLLTGAMLQVTSGRPSSQSAALSMIVWFPAFTVIGLTGAYAIGLVGPRRGLFLLTVGVTIGFATYYRIDPANPLKSSLGLPVVLAVFYGCARLGRPQKPWMIAGTLFLVVLSAYYDGRSAAAFVILAGALTVAPRVRLVGARIRRRPWTFAVGAVLMYFLGTFMLGAGLLGSHAKARYEDATRGGRNVIVASRQEWTAARPLFHDRPIGYGLGTQATETQVSRALDAVRNEGGSPDDPYWRTNVFASRVDLHSGIVNMWFHAGPPGVALALLLIYLIVKTMADVDPRAFPQRGLVAAVYFLGINAVWALVFSPMGTIDQIAPAFAICLAVGTHSRAMARVT